MCLLTSVSCFILSEKRFCPFLDPRVKELQEIVSKKSSFLYADCKKRQRIKDLFKLKQNLFSPSISKRKEILIKGKYSESYLMVWYHPMIFHVTRIEIILYSLYFCGCLSKRAPYFIFSELFIHGLKIKLFSELWSCVLRLEKSTTHDLHVYKYTYIYLY